MNIENKTKKFVSNCCNVYFIIRYKLDFLSTTSEPKEAAPESDIDVSISLRNLFDKPSQDEIFQFIDVSWLVTVLLEFLGFSKVIILCQVSTFQFLYRYIQPISNSIYSLRKLYQIRLKRRELSSKI